MNSAHLFIFMQAVSLRSEAKHPFPLCNVADKHAGEGCCCLQMGNTSAIQRTWYEISSATTMFTQHIDGRQAGSQKKNGSHCIANILHIVGSFSWTWRITMIRSPYAGMAITRIKVQQKEEIPSWKGTQTWFHRPFIGNRNTRYMQSFLIPIHDPCWIGGMRSDQSSRDHKKSPTPGLHITSQVHNHNSWHLQLTTWLKCSLTLTFREP